MVCFQNEVAPSIRPLRRQLDYDNPVCQMADFYRLYLLKGEVLLYFEVTGIKKEAGLVSDNEDSVSTFVAMPVILHTAEGELQDETQKER